MSDFHYRILVIDDDERIRRVSQDVLCHFGYEVRTAADGFEALALMRKALPDLIVSDLKMPNMSGFELLSVVRRRFPHIPVIAISGEFVGPANPEGLLADAFFHKGQYRCWKNRPFGLIWLGQTRLQSGYRAMETITC